VIIERLVATFGDIDDGESPVGKRDRTRHGQTHCIGSAMVEAICHRLDDLAIDRSGPTQPTGYTTQFNGLLLV
jgi:hypothetical protein